MANLVLAFAEMLGAAILLDAGIKGDSIANVINGQATHHGLDTGTNPVTTAAAPVGAGVGTVAGGAKSAGGSVASGIAAGASGYVNPVPGAQTGRVDQGVDYLLGAAGFLAPGRSQILLANPSDSGWGGGGYIAGKLLDGPQAGQVWYAAENLLPTVKVGDTVQAGAQVGKAAALGAFGVAAGRIEAGWADPGSPGRPLAQALPGYSGDQSTAGLTAGYSFDRFVSALGGVAGVFSGAGASLAGSIEHLFSGASHPSGVPY